MRDLYQKFNVTANTEVEWCHTRTTSTSFSPFIYGCWMSRIFEISLSNLSVTCCADLYMYQQLSKSTHLQDQYLLPTLTPVPPDVPLHLFIQPFFFPTRPDFAYQQALIITVVPLCDVFRERDFVVVKGESRAAEKMLECLLRTFTGTNPYAFDTGRVD
jgi:hypothetical protein